MICEVLLFFLKVLVILLRVVHCNRVFSHACLHPAIWSWLDLLKLLICWAHEQVQFFFRWTFSSSTAASLGFTWSP